MADTDLPQSSYTDNLRRRAAQGDAFAADHLATLERIDGRIAHWQAGERAKCEALRWVRSLPASALEVMPQSVRDAIFFKEPTE